jgi:ATP-dependent exoDNAse (exonuclease V) beta subunit
MTDLELLPPIEGLRFNEEAHLYVYDSKILGTLRVDSVSQVLTATGGKAWNPARWRQKLMREHGLNQAEADARMEVIRTTRAQIGTNFHALVQQHLLGEEVNTGLGESFDGEPGRIFAVWLREFLPRVGKVLIIEQPLIHKGAFYAGTPDLLAEIDGRLTLVDWKTCQPDKARVRQEWIWQQGAYCSAIKSCYNLDVLHGLNVMIWDGGIRCQPWNHADLLVGWQNFAGFLVEHHARQAYLGHEANLAALTAMESMFSPGLP